MQPKTIFLIDDDALTNYIHRRIISLKYTFNILEFTSPVKALERLMQYTLSETNQFPDIIFLDINMPYMNGWEFLEQFQKLPEALLAKCDVIMLTSSIDRKDIEKAKTYKVVKDFISKPLMPDKIATLNQVAAAMK
jgi:CheY-like chemotaxis protein